MKIMIVSITESHSDLGNGDGEGEVKNGLAVCD